MGWVGWRSWMDEKNNELNGNISCLGQNSATEHSFSISASTNTNKAEVTVSLSITAEISSLILKVFQLVQREFVAKQPLYIKANDAKNAFKSIQCCPEAFAILSKPPLEISGDQLRFAIITFENYLFATKKPIYTIVKNYWTIRSGLARTNLMLIDGRTTREELTGLTCRCKKPRKVVSSQGLKFTEVSTIEHIDIEALKLKAQENIKASLDKIEDTCKTILDEYVNVTDYHRNLKTRIIKTEIKEFYDFRLTGSAPWSCQYFNQPEGGTEETLLTYILQTISIPNISPTLQLKKFPLPTAYHLPTTLDGKKVWNCTASYYSYFHAEYFLPNFVLIAIAVLICQKTAWNPGSVGALTINDIETRSPTRFVIQSIKNKTDDKTPSYEVRKASEPLLFTAIKLLNWHHKQVTEIFHLSEKRVFIGSKNNQFSYFFPLVKRNLLVNFIVPFNCPDFSASELRPSRAGLLILSERDIEAVRVLLGHRNICTTDDYLQATILFQIREAIILEFQRRIETTTTFLEGGDELVKSRKMKTRHIDIKLMSAVPVGDGSRCIDLYDSPDPNVPKGELCSGLHCQHDGGCKNNIIVVDQTDIELAKKTQNYYRSRWSMLICT